MKRLIYLSIFMCSCIAGVQAQSLVLHVNGDLPDTLGDKTGNNTITNVNAVYVDNGALAFRAMIDSYISADSLSNFVDINQDWTVECKLKVSDSTDEIALVDFRSTSTTGNMYLYYNRYGKGLHFSDRTINGDAGHLVADYMMLPQNAWVTVKLEKANGRLKLYRDGVISADTAFTGTLSPTARTTFGYSEDRRESHGLFWMDDIKIWSGVPNTILDVNGSGGARIFPNPASHSLTIDMQKPVQQVDVYTIAGQKILSATSGNVQIEMLAAGNYLIAVRTLDGAVHTGRFTKE